MGISVSKSIKDDVKQDTDLAVKIAKEKFGQVLDFSISSLAALEELLVQANNQYKNKTGDGKPSVNALIHTANIWGSYLGEMIQQKTGGEWTLEENKRWIVVKDKRISPIDFTYQRITGQIQEDVRQYFNRFTQEHPPDLSSSSTSIDSPKAISNNQVPSREMKNAKRVLLRQIATPFYVILGLSAFFFLAYFIGVTCSSAVGTNDNSPTFSLCFGLVILTPIAFFILRYYNKKKKREQIEEQNRKARQHIKEFIEELRKHDSEKKTLMNDAATQFHKAVLPYADEKPCPRCNEEEVLVESLSPNARSMEVTCVNCNHKYRIKIDSENPNRIISLFNLYTSLAASTVDYSKFRILWKTGINKQKMNREPIPSHIKREVWRRDGGKCVKCGSTKDLQFDHIIPISKGGASTVANLQILCRNCNLKKHASIE